MFDNTLFDGRHYNVFLNTPRYQKQTLKFKILHFKNFPESSLYLLNLRILLNKMIISTNIRCFEFEDKEAVNIN